MTGKFQRPPEGFQRLLEKLQRMPESSRRLAESCLGMQMSYCKVYVDTLAEKIKHETNINVLYATGYVGKRQVIVTEAMIVAIIKGFNLDSKEPNE